MSRKCCLRTCRELSVQSLLNGEPQPHNYRIPRDPIVKAKWDLFVNQANHTITFRGNGQVVCARHFESSCFSETGRLLPNSVPTIADRFTLAVAAKYRVTAALKTTDLNVINNFPKSVVQLRESEPQSIVIKSEQADEIAWSNKCKEEIDIHDALPNICRVKNEEPACVWENTILPDNPGSCSSSDISGYHETITDAQTIYQKSHWCNSPHSDDMVATSPPGSPAHACVMKSEIRPDESEPVTATCTGERRRTRQRFSSTDISPDDFATPSRRRANVERVQKKLTELRRQVKTEKQKCRRVELRLRSLEDAITDLKDKHLISQEIYAMLPLNKLKN